MFQLFPAEMFPLTPSDIALVIDLILAIALALYFAIGHPRVWHRDRLGWVIFSYAMATVGLLTLIVYGIVFGQKIDEIVRFTVSAGLGVALVAKTNSVRRERAIGRMITEGTIPPERRKIMTETSETALAKATEIWYKAQRVLRTLVQVVIPAFLGFAVVLPLIIESLGLPVESELRLWLVGVALGVTAVASAIARVMAIPAVNAWLTKIGLGSVPQSAITTRTSPAGAPVIVVQEDPKASGRS